MLDDIVSLITAVMINVTTRAYIKMQEPRLSRTLHAPAVATQWHTSLSLKPIGRTVAEIEIDEGK